MANGFVQVAPDGLGKKIDNDELTVGGNTVYRQRIRICGTLDTALAEVLAANPSATELGVVTRPIAPTTSAGTPAGITVSTSSVSLAPANAARKGVLITNNGTGKLYLGHTSGVTASGATMGLLVPSLGSYDDSGYGIYTGALFGIYDAVASSQNVSVSERT